MALNAKEWYDQMLADAEKQEAARKAGLKTYFDETSTALQAQRDRAVGNVNTLRGQYEESLNPLRAGYQSGYDTSAAQAERGREQRIQDIMLASRLAENSDATRLQNLTGMGEAETLKSWRQSDLIKQKDTATSETNTQVQNLKAALDKQLAELEAQRQDRLLGFDAQAAQADTDYAAALTSLTSDYNLRLSDAEYQRRLNDLYAEYLDRLDAEKKATSRSSGSRSSGGGGFIDSGNSSSIDMYAASEGGLVGSRPVSSTLTPAKTTASDYLPKPGETMAEFVARGGTRPKVLRSGR